MAIQRVLQIHERLRPWLWGWPWMPFTAPAWVYRWQGRHVIGQTTERHRVKRENVKLDYVPRKPFPIVPRSPACLIQQSSLCIRASGSSAQHPPKLPHFPIVSHYLEDYAREDFQVTATGHFSKPLYQGIGATCRSHAGEQRIHLVL